MTADSELFTFETSRGKARLTSPRPTALGTVATGEDRSADHKPDGTFARGNQVAVGRSASSAIRGPYRAAEKRLAEALGSGADPSEGDRLLADALAVFHAARRELASRSAFVQGPVIAYAIETTLAGFFMSEAAAAGFTTDRGLAMHERAMACETQAARAMTAAIAATKALGGRKRRGTTIVQTIEAAGEEP